MTRTDQSLASGARPRPSSRLRLGALMLAVQPLYLVAELVVAAKVTAPYSLVSNTISDLGAKTCTTIDYPFGPVPVCSPWHLLMNSSFVVFSLLLACGALLLGRWLGPGPLAAASVTLWVVSSLSSVATGLVPLDQDLQLHSWVSLPVFLAQPLAVLTTALALRQRHRDLAVSGVVVGVFSLAAAVLFLGASPSSSADFGGLLERLALWPGFLWLPLLAVAVRNDQHGSPTSPSSPSSPTTAIRQTR